MAEQTSRLAIIIDSTGAEKNADNLAGALSRMTKEGESAASGARKVSLAVGDEREALSDLLGQINPVIGALNKLDKQQSKLDDFHKKGLLPTDDYKEYSSLVDLTRTKLNGFGDQLNKTGMSAKQTAAAMRMVPAQMTDIIVSLQGGQAPLTVLLQQGGQLKDMFGGIGPAAKAMGSYIGGLISPFTLAAAAIGVLGLAYYKGSQEQDEFYKSLTLTGNLAGKTSGQLADMAARVSNVTNSTTGAAASTLNLLISSGKVAGNSLERVTTAIVKISDATGIATEKLVGDFNEIAADPVAAINKLNDQYHFLTLATYNQIKALQDEGNQQEAMRVATDAYANTMQQRANDIHANLGFLEGAWDSLGKAAKSAWDQMLNVGREKSLEERLSDAQAKVKNSTAGYTRDIWGNVTGLSRDANADINILQAVINLQTDLTKGAAKANAAEQQRVKTQQEADRVNLQYLSNAEKRSKAIKQQSDFLRAGAITAEQYAKNVSSINEMFKEVSAPATLKGKSYSEDSATRLLDQIKQQNAALQDQVSNSDRISEATKARVKFEQQIADIKTKSQLTADQKSILSRSDEIMQAYRQQEALASQARTLDDYRKMQAQVNNNDKSANNLLIERLSLLDKAKAAGVGDTDATRSQILRTSPNTPPSTVTSVTGGLTPKDGSLAGSWGGVQQQMLELQQAQKALDEWQANSLASYADYYKNRADLTSEYEAQIADVRRNASLQQQAIDQQMNTIQIAAISSTMGSMVDITRTAFGEKSAIYKVAFAADKAYAIAQSMISIQTGIAQAAANPFPYNLAAMASVAAATSSIVSNISAVAGVGFQSGGYTGNGGVSSIAGVVHGKEFVFDAKATRNIGVSNLESIRKNGLDATLSKPGFGTGAKNVSNSSSTTQSYTFHQTIQMPANSGMTQSEMSAALERSNKMLVKELRSQTLAGKGEFGTALRAAQGRGKRME